MTPIERWQKIQDEQRPWVKHNFGGGRHWMPFMGMAEEIGELIDAKSDEDFIDAVGDITIYALDFMSERGISVTEVLACDARQLPIITTSWKKQRLMSHFGKLAHACLKSDQGIRGTPEEHRKAACEALSGILHVLESLLSHHTTKEAGGLLDITEKVWANVSKRDFKKWPGKGVPPTE